MDRWPVLPQERKASGLPTKTVGNDLSSKLSRDPSLSLFAREDDAGRIVTLGGERLCVSAIDGST
jgi:hypothetical protein